MMLGFSGVLVVLGAVVMLLATPFVDRPAPGLTGRVVAAAVLRGGAGIGLAYVWNTATVTT